MENTQRIKVDLSTAPWDECCGGPQLFEMKYMFKRLPALLSPTGKEEHIPLEIIVCSKCGKVPKFLWSKYPDLPDELKADDKK
jgi:hypothetical protein